MASPNVELLRRMIDGWNGGDRSVPVEAFDPEVEFRPLRAATEGPYRGIAGIEAFVADTLEVFESFEMRYEYEELGPDRVLAWGVIRVRGRGSGLETEIETGGVFDFDGGRIVRWQDFGSRRAALEAAGRVD